MNIELDSETRARVLNIIGDYYYYQDVSRRKWPKPEEYYTAGSQRYDVHPSKTNSKTDRTCDRATILSQRIRDIGEAKFILNAIENGIRRAADENKKTAEHSRLLSDLKEYLINKKEAEDLKRKKETMK